jgi:monofunctional biosynthetic peptidoglycan transglycosylase
MTQDQKVQPSLRKRIWHRVKKILLYLVIGQFVYLLFCKWINPPITITQTVNLVEGNGLRRDYIDYEDMGRNVKLAVMASEDQLFPDHDGFDIRAIKKAIKYNNKHRNKTRGASTISQQTAKNIFLWQHGGFFRKGLEVYFTFMIELLWSKERILENYLNVAEMGKGIFGVQAAAKAYFNKDAINLSRKEAAMIAACLPNPKKLTVKPTCRYVTSRASRIMIQMNNLEGDPDIEALLK